MRLIPIACVCLLAFSCRSTPDKLPPAPSPAWLTGVWQGEAFGGEITEWWSAPNGGAMLGAFQLVQNGAPVFCEIFNLVEHEGTWTMHLRHFNHPDLDGWEEKHGALAWQTTVFQPDRIGFGPVTYSLLDDGRVEVSVVVGHDGDTQTERFVMSRTDT